MKATTFCAALCPWGRVQHQAEIADGIIEVSTPSHGGLWLSEERLAALPGNVRGRNVYSTGPWFEEDCEWALVAVSFPDVFPDDAVTAARDTIRAYYPDLIA